MNRHRAIAIAAAIGFAVSLIMFIVTSHDYSVFYLKFRPDACPITDAVYPRAPNATRGWTDCGVGRRVACVQLYTDDFPGIMIDQQFPTRRECTYYYANCDAPADKQVAWAVATVDALRNTTQTCFHDHPPPTAIYLTKPRSGRPGVIIAVYALMCVFAIVILLLCFLGGRAGEAKPNRAPFMAEAVESPLLGEAPRGQ